MKSYFDNSVSSCVSLGVLFHTKTHVYVFQDSFNTIVVILMIEMCSS